MLFWYDENGIVHPWAQGSLEEADVESWREWIDEHGLVAWTNVGKCLVVTNFSGQNIPGGMFRTMVIDARWNEMSRFQSLTYEDAISTHVCAKNDLERAHRSPHGEYYPSRP
jgi:hypothetical protein